MTSRVRALNRGASKIHMTVKLGNRGDYTFYFQPAVFVGFCSAVAVLFLFSLGTTLHFFSRDDDTAATLALIDRYLKEARPAGVTDSPDIVEAKIRLLVQEYQRIKRYEQQLRERASGLDAVVNETMQLDDEDYGAEEEAAEEESPADAQLITKPAGRPVAQPQKAESADSGVGGGIDVIRPALRSLLPPLSAPHRPDGSSPGDTLSLLERQAERLAALPAGMPVYGRRTSGFGWRKSPFGQRRQFHSGVDWAVDRSSRVVATANGTVVEAGFKGALGYTVRIDHGNGVETLYGHLSKIMVKEGQKVCRSQRIGLVGSTGRSTGPHVHYEVLINGRHQDPDHFVQVAKILRFANIPRNF